MMPKQKFLILAFLILLPVMAACGPIALTPTDSVQLTSDALQLTVDAAINGTPVVVTEEVLREVTREVAVEVTGTPEPDSTEEDTDGEDEEGTPTATVEGAQLTRLAGTLTAIVVSSTPTAEGTLEPGTEITNEAGEIVIVSTDEPPPRNAGFTPAAPGEQNACDRFVFVDDITYPDNSEVRSGQSMTKTWRIQNVGTCTWTTGYKLVFISGFQLNAPNEVSIPHTVAPGAYVNLTVQMRAPTAPGTYRGDWLMFSRSGYTFGGGTDGNLSIWVQVVVPGLTIPQPTGGSGSGFTPGP
ncbi:MAG: hypothetical protein HND51_10385 [Chloroflexi bacterium]|nr:hypothetical protein [Chloroflexota bacterium]